MSTALADQGSWFVARLAERAKTPSIAAPVDFARLRDEHLVHYLDDEQIELVRLAYEYAAEKHEGQSRRTGHPYISHPLAVSEILASMRMDHQSLMAALLHDVIEDTNTSRQTLAERFGEPVAELVEGVSKLSRIFKTRAEAQAETFQRLALAMAKDLRVIMVKMADRPAQHAHNWRDE